MLTPLWARFCVPRHVLVRFSCCAVNRISLSPANAYWTDWAALSLCTDMSEFRRHSTKTGGGRPCHQQSAVVSTEIKRGIGRATGRLATPIAPTRHQATSRRLIIPRPSPAAMLPHQLMQGYDRNLLIAISCGQIYLSGARPTKIAFSCAK